MPRSQHRSFESTAHIRLIFIPAMYSHSYPSIYPAHVSVSLSRGRFSSPHSENHFNFPPSSEYRTTAAVFQASRELFVARYLVSSRAHCPSSSLEPGGRATSGGNSSDASAWFRFTQISSCATGECTRITFIKAPFRRG